ncbi:acyltransferase family protein [Paenibacillus donghaensis]|uniref:Acyltransferase 3 domain-containing protein n=1 Tax=Paenibacillus donghaensis TaxID=414771 RepID=A0A2Z2KFK8_9BACL|nr:acyltransferase [Paenibacillus donghaensis]ASA21943.1 hypothetical protein B9T62_14860 [Paenibacillus donghaensis]
MENTKHHVQRKGWIDFIKGISIIGVIILHTQALNLGENTKLIAFYCVHLFVLIGGINLYNSMERRNITSFDYKFVLGNLKKILIQYLIASIVCIMYYKHFIDIKSFIKTLIYFTASPQLYFLVFYCQLIALSPIIYLAIKKFVSRNVILSLIFIVILLIIAIILTHYTFVFETVGGGEKFLFGGSYILTFGLGMLFSSFKIEIKSKGKNFILLMILFVCTTGYVYFILNYPLFHKVSSELFFTEQDILRISYAIILFLFLFVLYNYFNNYVSKKFMMIFKPIELFGKYSMSIFLYHWIINDFFNKMFIQNHRVVLLILLAELCLPIILKVIYDRIRLRLIS